MTALQIVLLVVIALGAPCVVAARDPRYQVAFLSLYGVAIAILFLALQAPDVALSQLAVGVVLMPLVMLVTLAKVREFEIEEEESDGGEESEEDE